jgi:serine/threonine protein kinase
MFNVGETVDSLEIINPFGDEGSFGCVYKVKDNSDRTEKALKVFKSQCGSTEKARFEKENEILHKLNPHNYIIKPLSKILQINGETCYLLELADDNLDNYINYNYLKLSDKQKFILFIQICEGLEHSHSKKVVHRDLHNKNILLKNESGEDSVKITDFGKARDFESTGFSRENVPFGKINITPPEILSQVVDMNSPIEEQVKADIYALGIILSIILYSYPNLFFKHILWLYDLAQHDGVYNKSCSQVKRTQFYDFCLKSFKQENPQQYLCGLSVTLGQSINQKVNELITQMTNPDYSTRIIKSSDIKNRILALLAEIE